MSNRQLCLSLAPREPYSFDYFVPHSGVADAMRVLEQAIQDAKTHLGCFRIVFLCGPRGSGKSFLVNVYGKRAVDVGLPAEVFDIGDEEREGVAVDSNDWAAHFTARYEALRRTGGVLFIASAKSPSVVTENPHLRSRFLAGSTVAIRYPRENELRPLILSLLERANLRLSETNVNYLLRRLPADPLSFASILDRINELSLSEGRPANFPVIREVIQQASEGSQKVSQEDQGIRRP